MKGVDHHSHHTIRNLFCSLTCWFLPIIISEMSSRDNWYDHNITERYSLWGKIGGRLCIRGFPHIIGFSTDFVNTLPTWLKNAVPWLLHVNNCSLCKINIFSAIFIGGDTILGHFISNPPWIDHYYICI